MSIGTGKMMVEFFSQDMELRVWRYLMIVMMMIVMMMIVMMIVMMMIVMMIVMMMIMLMST